MANEKKYKVIFSQPKLVKKVVDGMRVLARSTGEDKLILVEALKQNGGLCAMSGDGSSDAIAMKVHDVLLKNQGMPWS